MTEYVVSSELATRLAQLSPERRALVERKLREAADASSGERAPVVERHRIAPRPAGVRVPLSFGQELLWALDQAVPGVVAYNVPRVVRINGALDIAALQRALDALVARHEILRTRFVARPGGPEQVIDPAAPVPVAFTDLCAVDDDSREETLQARLATEARRYFDLARDAQLRVSLYRLGADEHVLQLVSHHVVSDEWSRDVLFHELGALYDAARAGRDADLPPLAIQYADYAVWQRAELEKGELANQLRYWRERLRDLPSLDLPTDRPRTAMPAFEGSRYRFSLPAEVSEAMRRLAREHDATPFMTQLAAYYVLLHRYSGQEDIVVGSPVSTRHLADVHGLIGYFPNLVVLRASLAGDPSFAELLGRVRESALGAFEHQDVPLERLVLELRERRAEGHAPLFQVSFQSMATEARALLLGDAEVTPMPIDFGIAKFEMQLILRDTAEGMQGTVEYRSDLFDAATIERMMRHFEVLLAAALRSPTTPISQLPILTEAERAQQLVEWNDTDAAWPVDATLHGLFEAQARSRPDAVAVQCGAVALSYAELDRRANRLAHRLRARGVGPDTLVAVCMEKSVDIVATLFGILKAGGAYVPVDPAYPDDRIAFTLGDCGASFVLTDATLAPRMAALGVEPLLAADGWASGADASDDAPLPSARASNLCYVIYTSGSTGRPKGVLIEHRNVVRLLFNDRFQFGLGASDVWTVFHSFSFDFSVWEMYGALLYGGRVIVVPKETAQQPAEYLDLLEREGVTVLNQVPSAFYGLMQEELSRPERKPGLAALRYVIFGGEALQPALLDTFHRRYPGARLINMFGITETTVHVTFKEIGDAEIADGASNIGGPIPTLTTYVLDRHLALVPVGVTGEICVGGAGVARGYLNRPELTAERFVDHPFRAGERMYRSGDLGRQRPTGEIEYLGRRDAQVKIRGFRIELGEIETVLAAHPAVQDAVVQPFTRDDGDKRLVAFVVPANRASTLAVATDETIERWNTVFDATYAADEAGRPLRDTQSADPLLNLTGWDSSYTLEPIPLADMTEWVERTCERIRTLRPRRVLEIGCGTGLLLLRLAPECEAYTGIDFSAAALASVQRALGQTPMPHVTLVEGRADDLRRFAPRSVDTIIINSVVQYFPSAEYLVDVIGRAVELLADGGSLFIGDVRDRRTLEAFHTSVALHRAEPAATASEVLEQADAAMNGETELIIEPDLFRALRVHLPRISAVTVSPRLDRTRTEMAKYRYDVVLRIGDASANGARRAPVPTPVAAESVEDVRTLLRGRPDHVLLAGLRDRRVATDLLTLRTLRAADPQQSVQAIRAALDAAGESGLEPADACAVDAAYDGIALSSGAAPGTFDLLLRARDAAHQIQPPDAGLGGAVLPWRDYAHHSVADSFSSAQVDDWRRHLAATLPAHMVPSAFVRLAKLPLTGNGKVDRAALKAPEGSRGRRTYVAPRTDLEAGAAAIWADVLRLDRVGITDGFLDIGGHSLLAVRVIGRMRRDLGVNVPLALLLRGGTIDEAIAAHEAAHAVVADDEPMLAPVSRDAYRRTAATSGGRT